jgi:hypothetical protein
MAMTFGGKHHGRCEISQLSAAALRWQHGRTLSNGAHGMSAPCPTRAVPHLL